MGNCCRITGKVTGKQSITGQLSGQQQIGGSLNVGMLAVKTVYQYNTKFDFPTLGDVNTLYIAKSENAAFRWNDTDLHYYCVGRDYTEIELISGGNANG